MRGQLCQSPGLDRKAYFCFPAPLVVPAPGFRSVVPAGGRQREPRPFAAPPAPDLGAVRCPAAQAGLRPVPCASQRWMCIAARLCGSAMPFL